MANADFAIQWSTGRTPRREQISGRAIRPAATGQEGCVVFKPIIREQRALFFCQLIPQFPFKDLSGIVFRQVSHEYKGFRFLISGESRGAVI